MELPADFLSLGRGSVSKSKHIPPRHNTIRQLHSTMVISLDYVKSKDSIANPLTK